MKKYLNTYQLSVFSFCTALGLGGLTQSVHAGFEFYPGQSPALQTPSQQQLGPRVTPQQVPLQPLPTGNGSQIDQTGAFSPTPLAPSVSSSAGIPAPVQSTNLGQPRSGRFGINPYPINKDGGVGGQGLLYGQPVPTTPDGPVPLFSQNQAPVNGLSVSEQVVETPQGDIVQGFGKNLPLALAVQQIIPAGYSYSFQKGVELSSSVSWQGGRAWRSVLRGTLQPLGYDFQVEGDNIVIGRAGSLSVPTVSAYTQQPAPLQAQEVAPFPAPVTSAPAPGSQPIPPIAQAVTFSIEGAEETAAEQAISYQQQVDPLPGVPSTAYRDVVKNWTAPRSSSLREVLEAWSEDVGVDLYWAAEYDYPIQTSINRSGTFEEVTRTLLEGLKDSQPRPSARLHPNLPNGPAVLIVTARNSLN